MAILKATARTERGTHSVRKLRQSGKIPGVLYGHGQETVAITLVEHEMELAIQRGERVLEVDVDGQTEHALIKDIQRDTFGHSVLHVDLYRVSLDERVQITVPVILRGTPAGAADGGVLQQAVSDVHIECVVTSIPEELRVSVNQLKVGDTLHLRDIPLPEGAVLLDEAETLLCSVSVVAEEVVAPAEAATPAEPEVIGEKKEEEEEQEEAK